MDAAAHHTKFHSSKNFCIWMQCKYTFALNCPPHAHRIIAACVCECVIYATSKSVCELPADRVVVIWCAGCRSWKFRKNLLKYYGCCVWAVCVHTAHTLSTMFVYETTIFASRHKLSARASKRMCGARCTVHSAQQHSLGLDYTNYSHHA